MKIRNGFVSNSSSSSFVLLIDKDSPHLSVLKKLVNGYLELEDNSYYSSDSSIKMYNDKEEWISLAVKDYLFDVNDPEDMQGLLEDRMTGLFDLHPNKVIFKLKLEYSHLGLITDLLESFSEILGFEFFELYAD